MISETYVQELCYHLTFINLNKTPYIYMDTEEVHKIHRLLIMQVSCVTSELRTMQHQVSHGMRWKNGCMWVGNESTLAGNLCLGRQIWHREANSTTTWYCISCPQLYQGKLQTQVSFRTSIREWVCGIDGCLHCLEGQVRTLSWVMTSLKQSLEVCFRNLRLI